MPADEICQGAAVFSASAFRSKADTRARRDADFRPMGHYATANVLGLNRPSGDTKHWEECSEP
jgi:hypothetical protein